MNYKQPFSRRTAWNTEETPLARAHRARQASGLPIADLTASNPTRCGFTYPPDLLDALRNPRVLDYNPNPLGILSAREAVAAYYASHGTSVSSDQIILTTSTSEAYSFLFRLLCDPGSEILVPQPSYPLFDFLATLDDVHLTSAPLVYDHGWQIDPEALRRAITPATRAVVLVHPNNPTGHFTRAWEGREVAALCREHNLSLIVDEVFLDFPFLHNTGVDSSANAGSPGDPVPGIGIRQQPGPETPVSPPPSWIPTFAHGLEDIPVYVVSGLSKIAGLPQMKAAWILAAGPGRIRTATLDRLEIIADTFLSMNAPVQHAIPAWLASRHILQDQIRRRVAANLALLDRRLAAQPSITRLQADGGWYSILRIPAVEPDEATVLALLDRGAWVHPGYFYGLPPSGWLVLSLLAFEQEFSTGVTILLDYLGTDHKSNSTSRLD